MIYLVNNITTTTARFFAWWYYELGLLVPGWLRAVFYTPPKQLLIRLKNFQVYFSSMQQGTEQVLGQFYLHKEGQQLQAAFFIDRPEWLEAEKILLLNSKQLLKKRLDLPVALQENLQQVIAYELDRYTPFSPEQCYFATQVIGKNKTSNRVALELMVIAKQKLNYYCKELQAVGLVVDRVIHESDRSDLGVHRYAQHYNLMPGEPGQRQGQNVKYLKRIGVCCFGILAVIAVALPFWFQQQTLEDLQQRLAVARPKALEVEALQTEATTLLHSEQVILALKEKAPVMLNTIEQLSQLLPKDTWLKSFEYTGSKFLLQGLSASSSALIGLLEASAHFRQTAMVAPVTQTNQEKLDQFQLETYLELANDPG